MDSRRLERAAREAGDVRGECARIRTDIEQCYQRTLVPGVTKVDAFQLVWIGRSQKDFEDLWNNWVHKKDNYLGLLDNIIAELTNVQNALQVAADRRYAEEEAEKTRLRTGQAQTP